MGSLLVKDMRVTKLFKKYEFKLVKKNFLIFLICNISIILSIIAILSIQLTRKAFEESIENGIYEQNIGDIQIFSENNYFTEMQKKHLKELKNIKDISFFNKELGDAYTKDEIKNVVFINWSGKEELVANNKIQLDENIAKKLNVSKNDEIFIKTNSGSKKFNVNKINKNIKSKIFSDNELELTEDILGVASTNGLNFQNENCNGAIINFYNKSDIRSAEEEISKYLGSSFDVRSERKLYNNIKNRLNFQIQFLNFIAIIAYAICGLSVMFTFVVINIKRKRDFAVFKVLGLRKKQIVLLAFVEAISIAIISIAVSLPISIYCYNNISNFLFGKSNIGSSYFVIKIIGLVIPIVVGIVISSLIPMDIISNVPLITVFRKEHLSIKNRAYMFRSLAFILIPFNILSCILLNSINGIFITLRIMLMLFLIYTIIKLMYLLLSQIRRLFKKKYYITFKTFNIYRKNLAISSMAYILSMVFILFFLNSWGNLKLNKFNEKPISNKDIYTIEINENDEDLTEKLLEKFGINILEKNIINKSQIKKVNGKDINRMIMNRFPTSNELRADYYKYVKDLEIVWSNDKTLFPVDKDNQNLIIINTDFLSLLYKFKKGDIIKLNLNGSDVNYEVHSVKISLYSDILTVI